MTTGYTPEKDLDVLVGLLGQAATLAATINKAAPDGDLAYQAMMWTEYLNTFAREAAGQAQAYTEAADDDE